MWRTVFFFIVGLSATYLYIQVVMILRQVYTLLQDKLKEKGY